jgi:hypothetical protein
LKSHKTAKGSLEIQAFPNNPLAVLWDFKGLQGLQTQQFGLQIFSAGKTSSSHADEMAIRRAGAFMAAAYEAVESGK